MAAGVMPVLGNRTFPYGITYAQAIAKAHVDEMAVNPTVHIMGGGVADPKGIFGTTKAASDAFPDRVHETPLSENMLTGAAVAMASLGLTPVIVHARMDFLMLTMEHLVNSAAKYQYVHAKPLHMVIRVLVGRGWGQGPLHSQNLSAMLAHVPGIRVFMPSQPDDAYRAFRAACRCDGPVVIVEPRSLYDSVGFGGPHEDWDIMAPASWGTGRRYMDTTERIKQATIVALSDAVPVAIEAAIALRDAGYGVEVYEPQAWPLSRNGRENMTMSMTYASDLLVVDNAHATAGLSAEVLAFAAESGLVNGRVARVTPPFTSTPASYPLEAAWYPNAGDIIMAYAAMHHGHTRERMEALAAEHGPGAAGHVDERRPF